MLLRLGGGPSVIAVLNIGNVEERVRQDVSKSVLVQD